MNGCDAPDCAMIGGHAGLAVAGILILLFVFFWVRAWRQ